MDSLDFPLLRHLLSAYFHQDMSLEFGNWQSAVRQYVKDHDFGTVAALRDEVYRLLSQSLSEDALDRLMFSLHSYYYSRGDGYLPSEWLRNVAEELTHP